MSPRKQQVMNEDEINTRNNTPFLTTLPRSYSVMIDYFDHLQALKTKYSLIGY